MSDSTKTSTKLFFRDFETHLRRMRESGVDKSMSYRAQILLSQLHLFEKAVLEDSPGDRSGARPDHMFHELLKVADMDHLVTWLTETQRWFPLRSLFYLKDNGQWTCLAGSASLPDPIRPNPWLVRGQVARLDESNSDYALYLYGAPRIVLLFEEMEGADQDQRDAFVSFIARILPTIMQTKVKDITASRRTHKDLVARDPVFLNLLDTVERAAKKDITILLEGESGTGKEVIASFIHNNSERAKKPFITVNCAAIPAGLIESELFGHEKGAFTGAIQKHIGNVERAHGGTLFLDEIGEMEISMQAKLLRFLQLHEFHRVGGRQKITVDVRVVAATNRDLKREIQQGNFREDLYYRLSVMPFRVPPLRERIDDIVPLIRFFIEKYCDEFNIARPRVEPIVYQLLTGYSFPGNIRQLENLIQNILVLCQGQIQAHHLPEDIRNGEPLASLTTKAPINRTWRRVRAPYKIKLNLAGPVKKEETEIPQDNHELKEMKQRIQDQAREQTLELERRFLENLLRQAGGNIPEASRIADINRTLLYKMIERTGINSEENDA